MICIGPGESMADLLKIYFNSTRTFTYTKKNDSNAGLWKNLCISFGPHGPLNTIFWFLFSEN